MYKVFINNKSIFIGTQNVPDSISKNTIKLHNPDKKQLLNELVMFEQNKKVDTLIIYGKPEDIFAHFVIIDAAGGLVVNDDGRLLFIFRNGKWDLPKGKVEFGEKYTQAAVREVEEECGISGLTIKAELVPTYHTYIMNGQRCLKKTYWYLMKCENFSNMQPQTIENITEVKWLSDDGVNKALENSYASIIELIDTYRKGNFR